METASPPVTLILPNDLRTQTVARAFVESVCQLGGLDRATTDAVVLAAMEATSNVIRHAHRGRPAAQVRLDCRLRPEGIELLLHDEGEPFDLGAVPVLDPAEIRVGGRGVFLMRAIMDELSCGPRRDGRGNTLRMLKRCACHVPEPHCE